MSQAGSFTCPCHPGYENHKGNVGCSDVNECVISTGVGTCGRRAIISVPSDKLLRGEHQLQQLAGLLRVQRGRLQAWLRQLEGQCR